MGVMGVPTRREVERTTEIHNAVESLLAAMAPREGDVATGHYVTPEDAARLAKRLMIRRDVVLQAVLAAVLEAARAEIVVTPAARTAGVQPVNADLFAADRDTLRRVADALDTMLREADR